MARWSTDTSERAAKRLKPRSFEEVERHLRKHWSPLQRPAHSPGHAQRRCGAARRIAKSSGPFASNRARAALSALFSWAIGEGLIDATPVLGTNKATEEISRDRVLTGEELATIWNEAGGGDYGAIVRMLILTGQRREEVGGMLWSEIDLDSAFGASTASERRTGSRMTFRFHCQQSKSCGLSIGATGERWSSALARVLSRGGATRSPPWTAARGKVREQGAHDS